MYNEQLNEIYHCNICTQMNIKIQIRKQQEIKTLLSFSTLHVA